MGLVKTLMRRPLDRVRHKVSYCSMSLEGESEMPMFFYWIMLFIGAVLLA